MTSMNSIVSSGSRSNGPGRIFFFVPSCMTVVIPDTASEPEPLFVTVYTYFRACSQLDLRMPPLRFGLNWLHGTWKSRASSAKQSILTSMSHMIWIGNEWVSWSEHVRSPNSKVLFRLNSNSCKGGRLACEMKIRLQINMHEQITRGSKRRWLTCGHIPRHAKIKSIGFTSDTEVAKWGFMHIQEIAEILYLTIAGTI